MRQAGKGQIYIKCREMTGQCNMGLLWICMYDPGYPLKYSVPTKYVLCSTMYTAAVVISSAAAFARTPCGAPHPGAVFF